MNLPTFGEGRAPMPINDFTNWMQNQNSAGMTSGLDPRDTTRYRSRLLENNEPQPQTWGGKALKTAENVLGAASNFATRNAWLPLAQAATQDDPVMNYRLEQLKKKERPLYASDVTTELGLFKPNEEDIGAVRLGKAVGRFGIDVAGDPLTYLGIGLPTKLGRVSKALTAAREAGIVVDEASDMAKLAKEVTGLKNARKAMEVIPDFDKQLKWADQIRTGQRSFLSLDVPFTGLQKKLPILGTGKIAGAASEPLALAGKLLLLDKVGKKFKEMITDPIKLGMREIFSTSSGNAAYDEIVTRFESLAAHRAGLVTQDAITLNSTIDELSKMLGTDRDEVNRMVTNLVEKEKQTTALAKIPKPKKTRGPIQDIDMSQSGLSPEEIQSLHEAHGTKTNRALYQKIKKGGLAAEDAQRYLDDKAAEAWKPGDPAPPGYTLWKDGKSISRDPFLPSHFSPEDQAAAIEEIKNLKKPIDKKKAYPALGELYDHASDAFREDLDGVRFLEDLKNEGGETIVSEETAKKIVDMIDSLKKQGLDESDIETFLNETHRTSNKEIGTILKQFLGVTKEQTTHQKAVEGISKQLGDALGVEFKKGPLSDMQGEVPKINPNWKATHDTFEGKFTQNESEFTPESIAQDPEGYNYWDEETDDKAREVFDEAFQGLGPDSPEAKFLTERYPHLTQHYKDFEFRNEGGILPKAPKLSKVLGPVDRVTQGPLKKLLPKDLIAEFDRIVSKGKGPQDLKITITGTKNITEAEKQAVRFLVDDHGLIPKNIGAPFYDVSKMLKSEKQGPKFEFYTTIDDVTPKKGAKAGEFDLSATSKGAVKVTDKTKFYQKLIDDEAEDLMGGFIERLDLDEGMTGSLGEESTDKIKKRFEVKAFGDNYTSWVGRGTLKNGDLWITVDKDGHFLVFDQGRDSNGVEEILDAAPDLVGEEGSMIGGFFVKIKDNKLVTMTTKGEKILPEHFFGARDVIRDLGYEIPGPKESKDFKILSAPPSVPKSGPTLAERFTKAYEEAKAAGKKLPIPPKPRVPQKGLPKASGMSAAYLRRFSTQNVEKLTVDIKLLEDIGKNIHNPVTNPDRLTIGDVAKKIEEKQKEIKLIQRRLRGGRAEPRMSRRGFLKLVGTAAAGTQVNIPGAELFQSLSKIVSPTGLTLEGIPPEFIVHLYQNNLVSHPGILLRKILKDGKIPKDLPENLATDLTDYLSDDVHDAFDDYAQEYAERHSLDPEEVMDWEEEALVNEIHFDLVKDLTKAAGDFKATPKVLNNLTKVMEGEGLKDRSAQFLEDIWQMEEPLIKVGDSWRPRISRDTREVEKALNSLEDPEFLFSSASRMVKGTQKLEISPWARKLSSELQIDPSLKARMMANESKLGELTTRIKEFGGAPTTKNLQQFKMNPDFHTDPNGKYKSFLNSNNGLGRSIYDGKLINPHDSYYTSRPGLTEFHNEAIKLGVKIPKDLINFRPSFSLGHLNAIGTRGKGQDLEPYLVKILKGEMSTDEYMTLYKTQIARNLEETKRVATEVFERTSDPKAKRAAKKFLNETTKKIQEFEKATKTKAIAWSGIFDPAKPLGHSGGMVVFPRYGKGSKESPLEWKKRIDYKLPVKGQNYEATMSLEDYYKAMEDPESGVFDVGRHRGEMAWAVGEDGITRFGPGGGHQGIGGYDFNDTFEGGIPGSGGSGWFKINKNGRVVSNNDIQFILTRPGTEDQIIESFVQGANEYGVKIPKNSKITFLADDPKTGKAISYERDLKVIPAKTPTTFTMKPGYPRANKYVPPVNDPILDKVARLITERNKRQLEIEQTSGVIVKPLIADREYASHILTPEAKKSIREFLIKTGRMPQTLAKKEMNTRLMNALRREFISIKEPVVDAWKDAGVIGGKRAKALKGKNGLDILETMLDNGEITEAQYAEAIHSLGITEINQMAAAGKLKINGNKVVSEFFHEDPVYQTAVRGVRGERARTSVEFYNELKNRQIMVPEAQGTPGWIEPRQPELRGFVGPPEVVKALNKMYSFNQTPQEIGNFIKLFDSTQDAWKAWTLAIFPAYHTRNFVGNMWNNWLAGVNNPKVYRMAGRIQMGKPLDFVDGLGQKWTGDMLRQEAETLGVLNRGWVGADIQRSISKQLERGSWKSPGQNNKIIKLGFRVGKLIENNARMGHFIDRILKGDTPAEAAMSVKKYLFDYGDLTDIEKGVFKRLFPFYTWTRKNVPLQIQHLITSPAKFGAIFKVREELERGVPGPNEKYLPQWMLENFPTRIRFNRQDKKYEYFMMNSWLPAQDLIRMVEVHETAANMFTPLPKEILSQMFNYDTFLKKKIETIPGQKERFLGMTLPSRVVHSAKMIRLFNEMDKMTSPDTDLLNKITQLMTGKTYMVDDQKLFSQNKIRVSNEIQDLRAALRREAMKPKRNLTEILRIQALIQEKAKEY